MAEKNEEEPKKPSCIFSISKWSDRFVRWTRLNNNQTAWNCCCATIKNFNHNYHTIPYTYSSVGIRK